MASPPAPRNALAVMWTDPSTAAASQSSSRGGPSRRCSLPMWPVLRMRASSCASLPPGRRTGAISVFCGLHVLRYDLDRPLQLVGGAEFDDLRTGVQHGRVAGRHVVGVAGLERLLTVSALEGHLA